MKVIEILYDSEINCSVSTFWDGGYTAKLGDETNGFRATETFDCLQDAMDWLLEIAVIAYPNSVLALKLKG